MLAAHRSSIQKQSLPFLRDARYAMTIRIHYVHRNPVFDNTWWYANQGFADGSPSLKRRQKSRSSWDRDAKGYTNVVGYVWDSDHGLCPAVMTTMVRRFPLGMTIDDRGLRASDFFLVSFFFPLLYFLRCRHRSGGNENLIGGVFVHSRIVLHHFVIANAKERKRRNTRDGQRGQAWTVWAYQPRIDMCCAQWETFSGPVRSVAIFVRCTSRVMGKPGKPDIGHERNWDSFDKGSSRRVENITTREPSCM